jgi:hypothetical protein
MLGTTDSASAVFVSNKLRAYRVIRMRKLNPHTLVEKREKKSKVQREKESILLVSFFFFFFFKGFLIVPGKVELF